MKYYFIINPNSGKKDITQELTEKIYTFFEGSSDKYDIRVCESAAIATQTVKEISALRGQARICACGGDGTLNAVICGAAGAKNVEVGYYPAGSGNDFIKCFGEPEDFLKLENFVNAPSHAVDLISVNNTYCFNLLSVGIDADVNYCIPKYRRLPMVGGPMAYNMSLLECFFNPIGKNLSITLADGSRINGSFMLIALGNGRVYGGGYYATPEARYDDGLIDVVLIDKLGRLQMLPVIGGYKKGEHIKDADMSEKFKKYGSFFRTTGAVIESDRDFVVNIDGEPSVARRLEVAMHPAAFSFISATTVYRNEA